MKKSLAGSLSSIRLRQIPMSIAIVTMTILLICGIRQVQGGCSRFGHSCFGAHGKRADLPNSYEMSQSNLDVSPNGYILSQQPGYISLPNTNNGRISPYLIDWLLSARKGESKQQELSKQEDIQPLEMRKK